MREIAEVFPGILWYPWCMECSSQGYAQRAFTCAFRAYDYYLSKRGHLVKVCVTGLCKAATGYRQWRYARLTVKVLWREGIKPLSLPSLSGAVAQLVEQWTEN